MIERAHVPGGSSMVAMGLLLASIVAPLGPARAGCGCEKPAPVLAPIRPAFASMGREVTLFAPTLVPGDVQTVTFSGGGGATRTVEATVVAKRDFADGVVKPQLVVIVPFMPPGPTAVTVGAAASPALAVSADDFTVLPPPLPLYEGNVKTVAVSYQAVAGADGIVYLPVDIGPITAPMIFRGRAVGYRLVFGPEDVVIYNAQGVLMQMLTPADEGVLYEIDDTPDDPTDRGDDVNAGSSARSFRLTYDRHEFVTYRNKHVEDPNFALDPADPAWHVDGSRHVDHDHLVIAIRATVADNPDGTLGAAADPGTTPAFNFRIKTAFAVPQPNTAAASVTRIIDWPSFVAQSGGEETPVACASVPLTPCRQPTSAGASSLDVRNHAVDGRDTLTWRWSKGAATVPEDFGDVLSDHSVAACVYDESGDTPVLLLQSIVAGGARCGAKEKPCWKSVRHGARGYRFRDRAHDSDGVAQLVLRPGPDGKAGIVLKARGDALGLPAMPFGLPLRVQLQSTTGQCWEAGFDSRVRINTSDRFQGRSE
jgi:hypothetical protein